MAKIEIRNEATGVLLSEGNDNKLMLKELRKLQKSHQFLKYLIDGKTKFSIGRNL